MSGVGFSELLILFVIGLIVLGPERLPRVANQLGTWLGQARRMTRVMKRQLEEELDLEGKPAPFQPPPVQQVPRDDDTFSPLHRTADEVAATPADAEQAAAPVADDATSATGTDSEKIA
jgi:sec-independent protein translocase protein TatB